MTVSTERPSDSRSPSERVVRSVSIHADTDPLELPPLSHTVDPDALDVIVSSLEYGTVEFRYAGYPVTIDSDGTVSVTEASESGPKQTDPATADNRKKVDR